MFCSPEIEALCRPLLVDGVMGRQGREDRTGERTEAWRGQRRAVTEVDGEFDPSSVQLQPQRVGRLFGGGGHEQPVRPLGHEAQRHVLRLRVHGAGHDDLQIHAAVVAQHRRLCGHTHTHTLYQCTCH